MKINKNNKFKMKISNKQNKKNKNQKIKKKYKLIHISISFIKKIK